MNAAATRSRHAVRRQRADKLITRHAAVMASAFATLHHISGGRAHIGVGRGDTALELVGIRPPSTSRFAVLLEQLQAYLRGGSVYVDCFLSRISWLPVSGESKVPVDVFGSGPHVIDVGADVGARLGDRLTDAAGAEPERIGWAIRTAREARMAAGLDPEALDASALSVPPRSAPYASANSSTSIYPTW
jgi:5,10-methylenetetrahydromethanopterin reductase